MSSTTGTKPSHNRTAGWLGRGFRVPGERDCSQLTPWSQAEREPPHQAGLTAGELVSGCCAKLRGLWRFVDSGRSLTYPVLCLNSGVHMGPGTRHCAQPLVASDGVRSTRPGSHRPSCWARAAGLHPAEICILRHPHLRAWESEEKCCCEPRSSGWLVMPYS